MTYYMYFQIWITILIVLFTTTILIACYLWRKNKIRSKFHNKRNDLEFEILTFFFFFSM